MEVATRIFCPWVAGFVESPNAESTSAHLFKPETRASSAQARKPVAKPLHELVRLAVVPDLAERLLANVAERVGLPKLVGVNVALTVDVPDPESARVASAAVPIQEFHDFFSALGIAALCQHPEKRSIGGLINSKDLARAAFLIPAHDGIGDHAQGGPGLALGQEPEVGAATTADQMVKTHAGNVFLFDKLQDFGKLVHRLRCQREAESDFLAGFAAVTERRNGFLERAFASSELVVNRSNAIEGDADIGDTQLFQSGSRLRVDEGSVG